MKILVDTNIVLDGVLQREPFWQEAEVLFQAIEDDRFTGYVTATTITNIFYISRRQTQSRDRALEVVRTTLDLMEIANVDRPQLEVAFSLNWRDFEDALQVACAIADGLDAIVTRDLQDFIGSSVPIASISELLSEDTHE